MRVGILAVGRMKRGPAAELAEHYLDRFAKAGRGLGLTLDATVELPEGRSQNPSERKRDEAARLLDRTVSGGRIVALDECGDDLTSDAFAGLIDACRQGGVPTLQFLIGGPDGHGEKVARRSSHTVRFGRMTWPHQLVRAMLAEQLYRASTILSAHPYHRP